MDMTNYNYDNSVETIIVVLISELIPVEEVRFGSKILGRL